MKPLGIGCAVGSFSLRMLSLTAISTSIGLGCQSDPTPPGSVDTKLVATRDPNGPPTMPAGGDSAVTRTGGATAINSCLACGLPRR